MSKRTVVIIGIVATLVAVAIASPKIMLFLAGRTKTVNGSEVTFFIREEMNLQDLANALKEKNIIDDEKAFLSVGEYKGLKKGKIAKGKYLILSQEKYGDLAEGFLMNEEGNGKAEVKVKVTISNCRDLFVMASEAEKCLMLDSAKLVQYMYNGKTLEKFGFTPEQMPSMFYPGSYELYFDTDEAGFVQFMANQFNEFWNDERKAKLKGMGLTSQSQLATLASIVFSEQAVHPEEWPIIAGLYLNRLKKGMRLQSDPTFKFCWEEDQLEGVERLLRKHREVECPYNTYKVAGLPPGPICLTTQKVQDAVLNYAHVDYLFMCAKPDASLEHVFEVSDVKHMENATIYQRWLAKQLKKKNAK